MGNNKIKNQKNGFTLIEVMVSFLVIALGMVGALSLSNQNIQAEQFNKNTIIATGLAQEGLELVRNKRDGNWLKKEDWIYSSSTLSNFDIIQDGSYTIDYTGDINDVPNSISDDGAKLYLDSNGLFSHNAASNSTVFSRLILAEILDDHSIRITCNIRWSKGTNIHDISVATLLFNWR